MSWKDNLLDATYRGTPLQVIGDDLDVRRALAAHGMPYRDGDTVEDMGREARRFALRAVFFGEDYEAGLQAFLAALDTPGEAELVHPIYGTVKVVAERWRVRHDAERPDYADVDVSLVESSTDPAFWQRVFQTSEGAINASPLPSSADWRDGVRDLLSRVDSLVAQAQAYIGGGWTGLAEQLLGLPGIGLRLAQLRTQGQGVVSGMAALASTAPPLFDATGDPARVPVELTSLAAMSVPRMAASATTATNPATVPAIDVERMLSGAAVPDAAPAADALPAVASRAWSAALTAMRRGQAPVLASDSQGANVAVIDLPAGLPADPAQAWALGLVTLAISAQALTLAAATASVLDDEHTTPSLTPPQIGRLTGQARAALQAAILMHRQLYPVETSRPIIEVLRNVAALLQAGARRVVVARPPIVERTTVSDSCLRLLAHLWYGDQTRAVELLRLNPELGHAVAVPAATLVRAYAR